MFKLMLLLHLLLLWMFQDGKDFGGQGPPVPRMSGGILLDVLGEEVSFMFQWRSVRPSLPPVRELLGWYIDDQGYERAGYQYRDR